MTNHVLKHEGRLLEKILAKVQELNQLNNLFLQYLDVELAKHCRVLKLDRGCLVVTVDSANWGAQLRFTTPELILKLKVEPLFQNVKAISSKIKPNYKPVSIASPRRAQTLSLETSAQLKAAAQTIRDKALREILERIAKRL